MKNNKTIISILVVFIILTLTVLDFIILNKYRSEHEEKVLYKNKFLLVSNLGFNKLHKTSLVSWDDREITIGRPETILTILIFFQPSDCPACLDSLVSWNRVNLDYSGDVQIIAISPEQENEYYKELIELYKINYDLAKDYYCGFFRNLTADIYTPVSVYLNGKKEVIGFDILETLPKSPKELSEHINKYLIKAVED